MFQLQLAVALLMVELCPVGVTRHVDDHLPEPDLRANCPAKSESHLLQQHTQQKAYQEVIK